MLDLDSFVSYYVTAPMPPTHLPAAPLRHQDPYTRHGVHVSPFARSGLSAFAIHECGYLPDGVHARVESGRRRVDWHFPGVRSPYWRLYYNHDRGSFVRFLQREISLGPDRVVIIPEDVLFDCVGEAGSLAPVAAFLAPATPRTTVRRAGCHSGDRRVVRGGRRSGRRAPRPGRSEQPTTPVSFCVGPHPRQLRPAKSAVGAGVPRAPGRYRRGDRGQSGGRYGEPASGPGGGR